MYVAEKSCMQITLKNYTFVVKFVALVCTIMTSLSHQADSKDALTINTQSTRIRPCFGSTKKEFDL
jgi:hypothetical protein